MDEPFVIAGDFVFPVSGAPIARGAVVVEGGRVRGVGVREEIERAWRGARVVAMVGCAVLPGLVNAHTHLELGYLRGKLPPSHFVDWVLKLIEARLSAENMGEIVARGVAEGMAESLRGGVTLVGDIAKHVPMARAALRAGPVRAVAYGEIQAIGQRRSKLPEQLAAAADESQASSTMRIGLSPHAPYTVEGTSLQAAMALAEERRLPVCMHLAELAEEAEFLATLGGRIREPWEMLGTTGVLDAAIPRHAGGPIRWAQEHGLLQGKVPVVLAHVNYASDEELAILAEVDQVSVAYCPRTRTFFGHDAQGPHRFREMIERGINVCLATDSLASTPDLFLLREARHVLDHFPDTSVELLLEMITVRGARALGLSQGTDGDAGTLSVGAPADIAALPVSSGRLDSPTAALADVLTHAPGACGVWVEGRRAL